MSILVSVGSTNQNKITSSRNAFERTWPERQYRTWGVPAESGAPEQPTDIIQMRTGSLNRALNAMRLRPGHFAIGAEGGIYPHEGIWMEAGHITILDGEGRIGVGMTPAFEVPPTWIERMLAGESVDDICRKDYGIDQIGRQGGYCTFMTNGAINRISMYEIGIKAALSAFVQPQLFVR
jgi:inosine/xanthosine triphosphatase